MSGPESTSTASVRIGTRLPESESGDVAIELTRRLYHLALVALAILACTVQARAATDVSDVALERYHPAPAGNDLIWIPDADVDGNLELAAAVRASYARAPLVLETGGNSENVVSHQLVLHALATSAIARRFELSLAMPFVLAQDGVSTAGIAAPSGAAVGDLRIGARAQVVSQHGNAPAGALALELWAPTGDGDFASSPSFRYGASAIVGGDVGPWLWRVQFGARHRRDETDSGGLFGSEAHAGAGAGLAFGRSQVALELVGATGVESDVAWLGETTTHLEALLSGRQRIGPLSFVLGAGPGLTVGAGTPAYRLIAGVEVAHELAPSGASSSQRARGDRDGDGVLDRDDPCPDRVGSDSGCPPDADGDSIFDDDDACPAVAGPRHVDPKKHGCPGQDEIEPPDGAVRIRPRQIITEQIHFATGKDELLRESFAVLAEVARVLQKHPEIARVSVDGHTDDVGDDANNLTLSRRRALAVVRWLVEHGVDERRLEARGFGARQPLVEGTSDDARSRNRRVEFQIKRRTELGARGWKDGPVDE